MKKTILLAGILILIAVSGLNCTIGGTKSNLPSQADYRKGTKGLEMAFTGIIKEVPEYNIFQIPVELKNMGASDITEAYVLINTGEKSSPQDSEDFEKVEGTKTEAVSKKFEFKKISVENPEGEIKYAFLNVKAGGAGAEDSVSADIKATSCYDYKTRANADICIDTQKYNPRRLGARVCEVKEISLSGGQGGPLTVTKIKPDILYEDKEHVKPYFEITIENKGKGDSFLPELGGSPNTKSACLNTLGARRGKAYVSATMGGKEEKLDCDLKESYKYKTAELKNGKAEIACVGEPISMDDPSYETSLYIYLDYGYTVTESTTIKIKNVRVGSCNDYPLGSKCNDIKGTDCDAEGFEKKPRETKDCEWGCCVFIGKKTP